MGFPQNFTIAVISYVDETLSSTVTAILGGPGMGRSPSPRIEPTSISWKRDNPQALIDAGRRRGLLIIECIPYNILDPRRIDLWIMLDSRAENLVRGLIEISGPPPNSFYRGAFPDAVVSAGFHVPAYRENSKTYNKWFDELETLFNPWRERIWNVFTSSS